MGETGWDRGENGWDRGEAGWDRGEAGWVPVGETAEGPIRTLVTSVDTARWAGIGRTRR